LTRPTSRRPRCCSTRWHEQRTFGRLVLIESETQQIACGQYIASKGLSVSRLGLGHPRGIGVNTGASAWAVPGQLGGAT
jgi:hypothetical protein